MSMWEINVRYQLSSSAKIKKKNPNTRGNSAHAAHMSALFHSINCHDPALTTNLCWLGCTHTQTRTAAIFSVLLDDVACNNIYWPSIACALIASSTRMMIFPISSHKKSFSSYFFFQFTTHRRIRSNVHAYCALGKWQVDTKQTQSDQNTSTRNFDKKEMYRK